MTSAALALSCGGNGENASGLGGANGSGSGVAGTGASGNGVDGVDGTGASGNGGSEPGTVGSFDPAGGGAIEDCPAYTPGNNLDTCTMTYLTDDADDQPGAVDVHPNGAIIYAGSLRADSYGQEATELLGGGNAGIVRLSPDGRGVLSVTRLGGVVSDVDVDEASGNIAVSGDFGVAVLDLEGKNVVWSDPIGGSTGTHLDIGSTGTVAVGHSNHVTVYDGAGKPLGDFSVGQTTHFNDLALDDAAGTVFVTGFKQRDVGGKCLGKYKAGYLRAFGYNGDSKWTNYDWEAAEVHDAGDCSDTTGRGLTMGRDGFLYYVGTSDGGNTVHQKDPKDLGQKEADNVKPDKYQDSWGMKGAKTLGYFARVDPKTGDVLKGTLLVTRLFSDPNAGNSAKPLTIDADEDSNVFVGGATACCVPEGEKKTLNGDLVAYGTNPPDDYLGGSLLLVMSPDFMTRRTWMGVRGVDGNVEETRSVAIGANGAWVALTVQEESDKGVKPADGPLLTYEAMQPTVGGGTADAHLTVFRGPE